MPRPKREFTSSTQKVRRGKGSLGRKAGAAQSAGGSGATLTVTSVGPTGRVSGSTPTIEATVNDDEGINPSKTDVKLYLDGAEQRTFRYGRASGRLSYRPRVGTLSPGTHTVEVEVSTDEGRRTARKSWTFTVSR
jgi:hypothetical protein